jgi:hypothetical protein
MKTEHIKMVLLWLLVVVAIIVVTDTLNPVPRTESHIRANCTTNANSSPTGVLG